ncbi:hypothetical protein ZIOFF_027855 [Zingiber officinale]|uniref:Uncharacterized protein n=1 Tax=Zingiber officinale TaxID=94328 RepID=A0A8J5LEE9_ZINOF|nr:hypothetical protein ZIOFF_027855 [Zingiber officinale]
MAMASGSSRGSRKTSTTPSSALNNSRAPAPAVHHTTNSPGSDLPPRRNHQAHRGCRRRHRLGIKGRRLATRTHTVSNSEIHDAHGSSKTTSKLIGGRTGGQKGVSCVQMGATRPATVASSRRLAAALWHLHPEEFGGVERNNRVGFPLKCSSSLLFCAMEKATKWDPGSPNLPEDIYQFNGHLKLPEGELVNGFSVISELHLELERARSCINDLESERQSIKKKIHQFMKTLAKEKELWRRREHEKACNIIEHIKDDLIRERKNRKRLEVVNAKLVDELAEAKLSARRCLHDYEKERKAREIVEQVCEELAKEIREDKAEVEAIKMESLRLREEVDEEQRMLQMAEVWREERVQMKLIDAKLMLDEKYVQLCQLQEEIEHFLRSQSGTGIDLEALKEADMLQGAARSIKVHDIKEFYYQPPASEDIISVLEELKPMEETTWREREQYHQNSPGNHFSENDAVSPESDLFLLNPARNLNGKIKEVGDVNDDTDCETVSQVEEQASCNSPERSDPSVNGNYQESQSSTSGKDWDRRGDDGNLNSEASEICSTAMKQRNKKVSSIGRFWRSSRPKTSHKNVSAEFSNGRLSDVTLYSSSFKSAGMAVSSRRAILSFPFGSELASATTCREVAAGIASSGASPSPERHRHLSSSAASSRLTDSGYDYEFYLVMERSGEVVERSLMVAGLFRRFLDASKTTTATYHPVQCDGEENENAPAILCDQ